jgi:diguanylate cyclase (GGDEF)-like protein/PAS domain S-box-containing protein
MGESLFNPIAAAGPPPPGVRWPLAALVLVGLVSLGAVMALSPAPDAPGVAAWTRVELTLASAISLAAAAVSIRGTSGRIRRVRTWVTGGIGFWLLAEVIRDLEMMLGGGSEATVSHLPFVGVLVCAGGAYVSALRGHLRGSEEVAVYLDGAVVFCATAALMLTLFGQPASRDATSMIDLAYAIFFIATAGAALLLDLAIRAERRLRGAYVLLLGLVLVGMSFLWRVAAPPSAGPHEAGTPAHLLAAGIFVVMLGTITWTDAVDDNPAYVTLAARLRSTMPLAALGLTPVILIAQLLADLHGPVGALGGTSIALLLLSVAVRQSVLLRDRDSTLSREQRLTRELSTTEAKYRALVERHPGVVYLAEPGEHGRWHYVSPQIEEILGFTPEQWLADPTLWAQRIHPDDRERILAAEASPATAPARGSTRWEYRLIAADGRDVWVLDEEGVTQSDADGKPLLVQGVLLDITERKAAEEALRVSEEQTRLIIETASYAFIGMDADGRVIDWNQRAVDLFGWRRDEAIGAILADLVIPAESRAAHQQGLSHYLATGEGPILSQRVEVTALHRDGRDFPVELTIWPVRSGGTVRFNALVDDITVRKQLEEQLRHQALHDALTGLPNRVLFLDRVQHALDRADANPGLSVAVLFLDVDDFKTVNDSLGHTAGDQLLCAVADRLRTRLRPEDTAARLSGDEFAILIEDVVGAEPSAIASRLLGSLAEPFDVGGTPVSIQASIGVSLSGPNGGTPDELLRNADLAMYLAKARGKNRHELYTQGMHEQALRRLDLRHRLEQAISDERLEVAYQPVVSLTDGAIAGFEALLRWPDEERGLVPLAELIPLAEETGLIIPIGRFVLERACRDIRSFMAELGTDEPLSVAVNVSVVQLEHGSLVADVEHALSASGIDGHSLVLELTESSLTNDSLDTVRTLRTLRREGVRIALDDFGTGYSSLARLRAFAVDIVKIDRGFVAAMGTERGDLLVQSIIDLGRRLGMDVVAEGIETSAQLERLRERGAQLGQGYYFSRPVPAAAVPPLLAVGRLPLPRRRRAAVVRGA